MKSIFLLSLVVFMAAELAFGLECGEAGHHSTVCAMQNGTRACCPVKEASCCASGDFCCPKSFKCDVSSKRCVKDSLYIPFHLRMERIDEKPILKADILCPDKQTSCKDTQTCCEVSGGLFGCCPLLDALCCDDKIHCCPKNYKCNPSQGKCDRELNDLEGLLSIPWKRKLPGKKVSISITVTCPDGASDCPTSSTCCELDSGDYGCCPLENAVCCDDHEHCCPNGYTCDVEQGRCAKGDLSLPFYQKIKANKKEQKQKKKVSVKNVPCPGGASECPTGSTCCELSSGEYGCCPLENAVCCDDHEHCCPNGYTCDVKDGRCNKGDLSIPFYQKQQAKQYKGEEVVCPGGSSQCPDGTTCCQLDSGEWGCCPLENAVCCSDHQHCCPSGYTCDVKDGRCNKGEVSIPFFQKFLATKVKNVPCPGGASECPTGSTCCELSSGEYGCCPLENAVCCDDHEHCCPNGYTCDVKDGRCIKGDVSLPFYQKIKAFSPAKNSENSNKATSTLTSNINVTSVVCPDGCSFCPTGSTCCSKGDSTYNCCPLTNAVCCEDHIHCCPQGSVCDMQKQACVSSGDFSAWFEKETAKTLYQQSPNDELKVAQNPVTCPDNSTCDPLKSCCEMSDGTYGCCPYSDGICCLESYCCPSNTVCGKSLGECIPKPTEIKVSQLNWHTAEDQAKKCNEPKKNADNKAATCPGGEVLCSTESTCCQKPDGNFSCCPYKNGTCCGVHGYCCPNGYTCDNKLEACTLIDPDFEKQPLKIISHVSKRRILSVSLDSEAKTVDCDSVHFCSDSSTCCMMNNPDGGRSYGCCATPNAVCCNDGVNCCPRGYKCTNNKVTVCQKDPAYGRNGPF